MIELTQKQATALLAFLESFDLHITGAWPRIEEAMKDEWGIDDPEGDLEDAYQALQG